MKFQLSFLTAIATFAYGQVVFQQPSLRPLFKNDESVFVYTIPRQDNDMVI